MKFLPALAISLGFLYLGSLIIALTAAVSFEILAVMWSVK